MTQGASRRGFLAGLLAVPAAFVGARALGATGRIARSLRPRARGRSSTRCAICGAEDHAMLRCPRAPEVI
ncbi:hypothetical protein HRbin12_01175 [bacterium HR12]|nr:hypothetical protein HRbin12_01175 [bacterium HR12]